MEITHVTPEEQLSLDPSGKIRNFLRSFPYSSEYNEAPSKWYDISPDDLLHQYVSTVERTSSVKHAPYFDYVRELLPKWGSQGGKYSVLEWKSICSKYYDRAHASRVIVPQLRAGRDFLLRRIKAKIAQVGYPRIAAAASYQYDKYAAIPTGLRKGTYSAETIGMKPWRHAMPVVPGQRIMWSKHRAIFQVSVCDVRYIERELNAVREWLRTYLPEYFGSWLNPNAHINRVLSRAVRTRAIGVETDYKAMDQGMSLEIVRELILPIYELLIPDSYLSFASMVEEMFSSKLYWGDVLWEGLHNLFSGLPFTNDFETEYTVILAISVALALSCIEEVEILALGDDAEVLLPSRFRLRGGERFKRYMIDYSTQADMEIHADEKSRVTTSNYRYLRRVYYPAGFQTDDMYIGNYPMLKALNNIIQPEKPIKEAGVAAIADLQRLDNAFGVPEFVPILQYLMKHSLHKFAFTDEDLAEYRNSRDWWATVYGEVWSPNTSPTFKLLYSSKFN